MKLRHTPEPTRDAASVRATVWDRLAILALGAAGFALSYDALRQTGGAIHVRGALTYVFPLVIDGFIAYGVRALVVLRAGALAARVYAWLLVGTATGASIWANALHAVRLNVAATRGGDLRLGDATVGLLSTIAPLALAGAVHLYILIARSAGPSGPEPGPGPVGAPPAADGGGHDGPGPLAVEGVVMPSNSHDVEELLPVARGAVAEAGRLNRAVVAAGLRAHGIRISNDRLGALLAQLRDETAASHPSIQHQRAVEAG